MIDAGSVAWVDFDPVLGHEQAGLRPGLIVSSRAYNDMSSLLVVCPISRGVSPWPWKVPIPPGQIVQGAVLVDQVKSIDRESRLLREVKGRLPETVLAEVRGRLAALLGIALAA